MNNGVGGGQDAIQAGEWTAHQKAGQIAIWLYEGQRYTTPEVAKRTGMTYMGAKYMLEMMSMVLPIVQIDGKWEWQRQR